MDAIQNRLQAITAQITEKQGELLIQELTLDTGYETRLSVDTRKSTETTIQTIKDTIAELEGRKRHLSNVLQNATNFFNNQDGSTTPNIPEQPSAPSSPPRDQSPRSSSTTGHSSPAQDRLIPQRLPGFRNGADSIQSIHTFILEFETQLEANCLSMDHHWARLLPLCLPYGIRRWYEKNIDKSSGWMDACKILKHQFGSRSGIHDAAKQLQQIYLRRDESILDFTVRFQQLMDDAGLDDANPLAITAFEHALPEAVMGHLQAAVTSNLLQEHSVSAYASYAATFQDYINRNKLTKFNSNEFRTHSKTGPRTETRADTHSSKPTPNSGKWCPLHRATSHSAEECKVLLNRTPPKDQPNFKTGTETKFPAKPAFKKLTTTENSREPPNGTHNPAPFTKSVRFARVTMPSPTDGTHLKPFEIPIMLNGIRQYAFVDSGASCNVISKSLVEELNIAFTPQDGHFQMANPTLKDKRIGLTEPLRVCIEDISFTAEFEIMDTLGFPPICIGQPAILQHGFDRLAFAYKFPDTAPPPDNNKAPSFTTITENFTQDLNAENKFKEELADVIKENTAINPDEFCPIPEAEVHLPTEAGKTAYKRQFPIAHTLHPVIWEEIQKLLDKGVIERAPTNCSFNTPIFVVPRKDATGKLTLARLCLDYRPLNALIPDDLFPIPLISDIFESVAGANFFTTLDLQSAYHRFPIAPSDRHKTAFTWDGIQYVFRGAPFGLKNMPSIFQRVMTHLFADLPFVKTFIDDIVVYSATLADHIQHVRTVIDRLNKAHLILNVAKCHFCQTSVKLLGFIISKQGRQVDRDRLINVQDWPRPKTTKQLQHYLGFSNYFREHIPMVSKITAVLNKIRTAPNLASVWDESHDQAFNDLKQALLNCLPLSFPDFTKEFIVATDASDHGLGAVLYQLGEDGSTPSYISFQATSLKPAEKNYSATKRELLAVVFALKRFHAYLWGRKFQLYTDHSALTYLHTQATLNPMMIGWHQLLADYSFRIHHRPGIQNILPDHLSRFYDKFNTRVDEEDIPIFVKATSILEGSATGLVTPPVEDRPKLLERFHLLGHFGTNAMVKAIHDAGYHWNHLKQEAAKVTSQCKECLRFNIVKHGYHPLSPISADTPFEHVAIDLAGPFATSTRNNHYLFVLVDVHSRFTVLRALPDKSMNTIAETLIEIFCNFGFPKIVQSDNGTEFVNKVIKHLTSTAMIDHRLVTPYHPRANGLAERYVQTATRLIKKLVHGVKKEWDDHIPFIQYAINIKTATIHNSTPFTVMFGRKHNAFEASIRSNSQRTPAQTKLLLRLLHFVKKFSTLRLLRQFKAHRSVPRINSTLRN